MGVVRLRHSVPLTLTLLTAAWLLPAPAHSQLGTLSQKHDIAVQGTQSLAARWQKLSPSEKALSYLKRVTPFYSWIVLCNATMNRPQAFSWATVCLRR